MHMAEAAWANHSLYTAHLITTSTCCSLFSFGPLWNKQKEWTQDGHSVAYVDIDRQMTLKCIIIPLKPSTLCLNFEFATGTPSITVMMKFYMLTSWETNRRHETLLTNCTFGIHLNDVVSLHACTHTERARETERGRKNERGRKRERERERERETCTYALTAIPPSPVLPWGPSGPCSPISPFRPFCPFSPWARRVENRRGK